MTKKLLKTVKSIRFRLTFVYSGILFIFSAVVLIALNSYLSIFLSTPLPSRPDAPPPFPTIVGDISSEELRLYENELERRENQRLLEARSQDLKSLMQFSVYSLLPLALFSFATGYYVSGRFLSPLHDLNAQIKKLKVDGLGKKIPKSTEDEIGDLVDSFNEMSERLEKYFKLQKEFVQDAAHELKTPLTIITVNLDTIMDDKDASVTELRKSIKNALQGIDRINGLTENLLNLTLPSSQNKNEISIIDLIKNQVSYLQSLANIKKVNLKLILPDDDVSFLADKINFERAIFNIIENAIKYSSAEGNEKPEVIVKVGKEEGSIKIEVRDNGAGISKKHQARIFDRFYRAEKSRNKNSGGFGMGLAIAKKIIEEHGGKIILESKPGQTVFTVVL